MSAALLGVGTAPVRLADQQPSLPSSIWPSLLAAQYTFIDQNQFRLRSPYSRPLSLDADGGTKTTNTMGVYARRAPVNSGQLYLDVERFDGAGVSGATGLAGLTNGDVVREGAAGIKKELYVAPLFTRFMLPLHDEVETVERAQDQIPGSEATTRLELKLGRMAVTDDFDQNRHAGSPRTQFLNWSLWATPLSTMQPIPAATAMASCSGTSVLDGV